MIALTRRSFSALALAGVPRFAPGAGPGGVIVGVHTYSFRDRSLDATLEALVSLGVTQIDMGGIHLQPKRTRPPQPGYAEILREWRLTVPLSQFEAIGRKFRDSGVRIANYTHNFMGGTDPELERGFEMARALGASSVAMSTRVSLAPRVDAAARKFKMRAGIHNHSRVEPDQLATPEDFAAALKGASEYLSITLDVGHFVAAGFDPVPFIEQNHSRILNLHLKDRKANQGPTVPHGDGAVPITAVLRLLRDRKYPIAAYIEHEYEGDAIAEVRKALAYCKQALQT
jgi:sugar phosphate isomerase/epimerase